MLYVNYLELFASLTDEEDHHKTKAEPKKQEAKMQAEQEQVVESTDQGKGRGKAANWNSSEEEAVTRLGETGISNWDEAKAAAEKAGFDIAGWTKLLAPSEIATATSIPIAEQALPTPNPPTGQTLLLLPRVRIVPPASISRITLATPISTPTGGVNRNSRSRTLP